MGISDMVVIIVIQTPVPLLLEVMATKLVMKLVMMAILFLMMAEPLIVLKLIAFGLVPLELDQVLHLYVSLYAEMVVMQTQGMKDEMMAIQMMEMAEQAPVLLKLVGSAQVA